MTAPCSTSVTSAGNGPLAVLALPEDLDDVAGLDDDLLDELADRGPERDDALWTNSTREVTEMPRPTERDLGLGLLHRVVDPGNAHSSSPILCRAAAPATRGDSASTEHAAAEATATRSRRSADAGEHRARVRRAVAVRRPGPVHGVSSAASAARPDAVRRPDGVAGDLGPVELLVGPRHQLQRVGLLPGHGRHAEGQAQLARRETRRHAAPAVSARSRSASSTARSSRPRHEDGELVAAQPRDEVARRGPAATSSAGHLAEHLVAAGVPVPVVHGLEVVDVEQHDRDRAAVA